MVLTDQTRLTFEPVPGTELYCLSGRGHYGAKLPEALVSVDETKMLIKELGELVNNKPYSLQAATSSGAVQILHCASVGTRIDISGYRDEGAKRVMRYRHLRFNSMEQLKELRELFEEKIA
jgi:hypothetical protein